MPERDLPALWESDEWLAALQAWLVPALDAVGVRATAPVVRERVRFWSVVARVETDAGRVDEPFLRAVPEWLVDAAAPDPYACAGAR